MASNGSYTTNAIVSSRTLTFSWSLQSQNIANNTSTIYWELKGSGGTSTSYVYGQKFRQTVDGATSSSDANRQVYNGTLIMSGTKTISHNADGTKSFSANTVAQMYNYTDNTTGSGSWVLPTIPRQANLTGADNFNDEGNPTITYTNSAGNSVSSLQACISLTGATDDIKYRDISKTGSSYTFNLTTAERDLLRSKTPNSNTLGVIFYVQTVISGNTYRSTLSRTMTIINGTPTVSSLNYADTNEETKALTDNDQAIVSGYSSLRISDLAMSSFKFSTLKQIIVEDVSEAYSANYTKTINNYAKNNVGVKVVDSRGNTSSIFTKTFTTFVPYKAVAKGNSNAMRGGQGVGEDVTISCTGTWYNGGFGVVNNSLSATYEWKKTTDSEWHQGETALTIIPNANNFTINQLIKGDLDTGFNISHAYDIRVIVTDALSSVTFSMLLMAGQPAIAILGNKIALGGKFDENRSNHELQFNRTPYDKAGNPIGGMPIRSVYLTVDDANPSTIFGGTWVRLPTGFLLHSTTNDPLTSGGSRTTGSTAISAAQLPAHRHPLRRPQWYLRDGSGNDGSIYGSTASTTKTYTDNENIENTGSGQGHTHTILPDYVVIRAWYRTA